MRNISTVADYLVNWYPNIINYQETDSLNENKMTDEAIEYYKGALNKRFGIVKKEEQNNDRDRASQDSD